MQCPAFFADTEGLCQCWQCMYCCFEMVDGLLILYVCIKIFKFITIEFKLVENIFLCLYSTISEGTSYKGVHLISWTYHFNSKIGTCYQSCNIIWDWRKKGHVSECRPRTLYLIWLIDERIQNVFLFCLSIKLHKVTSKVQSCI